MAVKDSSLPRARRIARFSLTTPDAHRLAAFYASAFDCRLLSSERIAGAGFEELMNVRGGAQCLTLSLGREIIELLEFDRHGRPHPEGVSPLNVAFQHFAIVVGDVRLALQRLEQTIGWTRISDGVPQQLPERSGGVTAFKFRDPDGHPLEFLAFPRGKAPMRWPVPAGNDLFFGVDHSAISVADTERSVAFYGGLGFRVASQALNHGIEQQRLDGIVDPHVEVTALAPGDETPHIELLCYRALSRPAQGIVRNNDAAATRLVIEMAHLPEPSNRLRERIVLDPDGHRLQLVPLHSVSAGAKKTSTVNSSSMS
jgi:catechol 2,3-dioxygenase-like lactoylglutathione lyase family enzyme